VAAELDVVEHRHAAEQRDVLEGAREPELGALRGGQAGDVLAAEADVAAVGPVEAGNGVEQRGLAGAVGADHGRDGTGRYFEADAVQGRHAAE
jgi:hypothetical protein